MVAKLSHISLSEFKVSLQQLTGLVREGAMPKKHEK